MSYSPATKRKIAIICEHMGNDWRKGHPDVAIDTLYNKIVGDKRRNMFCKIDSDTKIKLDEMAHYHNTTIGVFIEHLLLREWSRYQQQLVDAKMQLMTDFGG